MNIKSIITTTAAASLLMLPVISYAASCDGSEVFLTNNTDEQIAVDVNLDKGSLDSGSLNQNLNAGETKRLIFNGQVEGAKEWGGEIQGTVTATIPAQPDANESIVDFEFKTKALGLNCRPTGDDHAAQQFDNNINTEVEKDKAFGSDDAYDIFYEYK